MIGAPLDLGAASRRGVDMGPSAIRYAGLGERLEQPRPRVPRPRQRRGAARGDRRPGRRRARATSARSWPRASASPSGRGGGAARASLPLVLGGDHSIALGTLGGLASVRGPGGVLWLDAHGDLNTPETTPSGNVHGMPLAAALGRGRRRVRERRAGRSLRRRRAASRSSACRSLDDGRARADPGARPGRLHDERDRPARARAGRPRCARASSRGASFVHVSLDMDVVDPEVAPGRRHARARRPLLPGGAPRHGARRRGRSSSARSRSSRSTRSSTRENATARLAVELVASALGARIL